MREQIIEILNRITEEKGSDYTQVLVEGINIGYLLSQVEPKAG